MPNITLTCDQCTGNFTRTETLYNSDLKRGRKNKFCSPECHKLFQTKQIDCICSNCNTNIKRTKSQLHRYKHSFCSHKCAGTFTNSHRLSRKSKQCVLCPTKIDNKSTYCKECWKKIRASHISPKSVHRLNSVGNIDQNRTIADLELLHGKSSKYSYIRMHARAMIQERSKVCERCGYSKYVECCHKKAIKDFPKDTPILIVNNPENLMLLCPNCHVEFDRNL